MNGLSRPYLTRKKMFAGPLIEGKVGGDQDGPALAALAEDLEKEFSPGGGQEYEAQFVDDQQVEVGQLPLEAWLETALFTAPAGNSPLS